MRAPFENGHQNPGLNCVNGLNEHLSGPLNHILHSLILIQVIQKEFTCLTIRPTV